MPEISLENIFKCSLFMGFPENFKKVFLDNLQYKIKEYKKGEYIANQGDKIKYLYVLMTGIARTEMVSESGNILFIETINAPSSVASAFLFSENNRFPVDVVALNNSIVLLITKDHLTELLGKYQFFMKSFLSYNSNRINFLSSRLKYMPIKTIKGKIAAYILQKSINNKFELENSITQLADYFAVARPSLSRCLSEMVADNIITFKNNGGEILNIDVLKELIIQ